MAEENQKEPLQSVQVFGRKKTATAVAYCKRGKGLLKVNGRPLELVEPKALQFKLMEPVLLLGKDRYSTLIVDLLTEGTIIVKTVKKDVLMQNCLDSLTLTSAFV